MPANMAAWAKQKNFINTRSEVAFEICVYYYNFYKFSVIQVKVADDGHRSQMISIDFLPKILESRDTFLGCTS